ncbi:hypothetical protein KP509_37G027400 [Ceratopteris richardii]|uniref:Tryptophan synthase beta chain-like PALP domain-containing protein n=1 Tax=Ceratopteris richardii TaxID=49495 RepID=A0A8T2Q7M3_CERRI|nr:hypothetical protein KP509_37G027400 [Ceratopteris richardii]
MASDAEQKETYAATLKSIQEARERISGFAHVTPVFSSCCVNQIARANLYFKCELLQKSGAFKFRGACNAVLSLPKDIASRGVITHSSGNHAAALALAAKIQGIPAFVIMPKNAPKCKVENVKRYGGKIYFSEPTLESREEIAQDVQKQTGATLIHPYNDTRVISGQGTIALELLEQIPELDALIVPISGGGLISGITLAAKSVNSSIRIFAAEPKGADDAAQSKAVGKLLTNSHTDTIADGLRASLGSLTWFELWMLHFFLYLWFLILN